MNYLDMVTRHKCDGSGYPELLVESKLAINTCLTSALSGKAYDKASFAFKTVCEVLQRLLMEEVNAEDHNPK